MGKCKWCNYGTMYVGDGSGITYRCTDCGGTGWIPECDVCGQEYTEEYCEECYDICKECGEVREKSGFKNGICAWCLEDME